MIHWIRPYWFVALLPALILVMVLWRQRDRVSQNPWTSLCDPHLLSRLCPHQGERRALLWPYVVLLLVWMTAIVAMAGPSWQRVSLPSYAPMHARVIILDMSDAMQATDLAPSRLARARFKLSDYLAQLRGGQVGLIALSRWPYLVAPLTEDTATVSSLVGQLTPAVLPSSGYRLTRALAKAEQLFAGVGAERGDILLLSAHRPDANAWAKVKALARRGIHTSVWAFGTAVGGPIPGTGSTQQMPWAKLDVAALQQLAQVGQGQYIAFRNGNEDVQQALALSAVKAADGVRAQHHQQSVWLDQGRWLVLLILLLLVPAWRRGMWSENG